MTYTDEPTPDRPADEAVGTGRAATGPEAVRRLVDQLHRSIDQTFADWNADASTKDDGARRETQTFSRPVAVTPVRMEQMARAPEPTADLDDLVDLLVPRLLEQMVPALREALSDDD